MAIAAVPTNFYAQCGNNQVYLLWDIISGATSYQIQRSTDGVNFTSLNAPAVNFYLDTTVVSGTIYYYQVASVNGSGTSAYTTAQMVIPVGTGQMTLSQVRLLAQQRADRVNSSFVTLPEWNTYINQSYFELYDLLTTVYEKYNAAPVAMFQTDGVNNQFALPDGVTNFLNNTGSTFVPKPFYKLLGVDCGLAASSNAWVTLHRYNFIERNRFIYPNVTSTFLGVFNLAYDIYNNNLFFIPTPSAGQYIRLWYIPRITQLLQETDILDGISGWTEYVVIDAAIKALNKEESDSSALMNEKMNMKARIEESAANRDAGSPETIANSRGFSMNFYGNAGSDGSFGGY